MIVPPLAGLSRRKTAEQEGDEEGDCVGDMVDSAAEDSSSLDSV